MDTKIKQSTYTKKPVLNSKAGQYIMAKKQGNNKNKSKVIAGYSPKTTTKDIEETKTYQALEEKYYKDELIDQITLKELAEEQVNVIKKI